MTHLVKDADVDSISIKQATTGRPYHPSIEISGPAHLAVLTDTLDYFTWSMLPYVIGGLSDRSACGIDGTGFRYPGELDPGEEPFEGVNVYNPLGELYVSIPAFERLMSRYLGALIKVAEEREPSVMQQPWWPDLVSTGEELTRRLAADSESAACD
jgi:hypothetical protein